MYSLHLKAGFCLPHHSAERGPDCGWLGVGPGARSRSLNASSAWEERIRELENAKDPLDHLLHPQEGRQDCPPEVAGMETPAVAGLSWSPLGTSAEPSTSPCLLCMKL